MESLRRKSLRILCKCWHQETVETFNCSLHPAAKRGCRKAKSNCDYHDKESTEGEKYAGYDVGIGCEEFGSHFVLFSN